MKLYRFLHEGAPRWGRDDANGRLRLQDGDPVTGLRDAKGEVALAGVRLLAPVTPSKVVAIGLNYKDHAAERGKTIPAEPLMFLKPPSSVIASGETIEVPSWAGRIDHEAEMGVVIGTRARDVADAAAGLRHVLGAVCVNDVTARELQDKDVQFTRAKGFDTFCPVGPCLATGLDYDNLRVTGRVNGEVRQQSSTAQLIFDVGHLVWAVSRVMTLEPGDIISTGTPSGIGPLRAGDVVEIEVEGIGILRNPVGARGRAEEGRR
jgi:2-keto-4-pentenoate hydratase/2-oxohepta-3-ene-1,7-dioic acid hydratase in catechol pathway